LRWSPLRNLDKQIVRKGESAKIILENRGGVGIIGLQEFVQVLVLRKKIVYPLFFLFFWIAVFPLFAEEEQGKDRESDGKPLLHLGQWEFDAGGQVLLRGDFTWNQNLTDFRFTPGLQESQFLERTRLQVSVENRALNLEGFVQGQWYGRWGGTVQRSAFDLYQGYIKWENILGVPASLKAGRQEFLYGSAYFIGTNDFYNGLVWDGAKGSVKPFESLNIDLLGSKMVKLNPGDPDVYLAGLYTTYKIYTEGSLEGYLFYNKGGFPLSHREFVLTDSNQKWFTLGGRFAGKVAGLDYELEPLFQWGTVKTTIGDGRDPVRTYGGHINLGYTFKLPWEPRVFGTYAYGSGDSTPFDGKYTEFHNIFNDDDELYGRMKVIPDQSGVTVNEIHASGLQIWVAGLSINPLSKLNLSLQANYFLANKVPSGFSKYVGTEVDLAISYQLRKGISFILGLSKFYTGSFFEEASGSNKNMEYIYIQAEVEF